MTRAALYARYSDERQNPLSIADQVAVCTRHAEAKGWAVARIFSDAALSGAAMANRPGLLDAVAAAERGEFDVLLCEHEDRLHRNLEHLAHVFNRLSAAGVAIATLASDRIGIVEVGVNGMMAELYLANLGQKTRRGMRANAEAGKATGSRTYGYATAPGGAMTVVEAEAEVIRDIVDRYLGGETPRQIAGALNAAGVPAPRGGLWNASSINGSRQRANGILHTDLYGGVKVWNRMEVRKDRTTGRRTPVMKPEADWKRTPVPQLRIVDDDRWAKVQARKARESGTPARLLRRPPTLFSGLLRCGLCGGSYTVYSSGRLTCAAHRERGDVACINRRTPSRADIEQRVLTGLRERMLAPDAIAQAVRTYHQAADARRRQLAQDRAPLERRLGEVTRKIERIVDAICDGTANKAMTARMKAMDEERLAIAAQLQQADQSAAAEASPIRLHPGAVDALRQAVQHLQDTLASAAGGHTAAERDLVAAVRALVERVDITPVSQDRGAPYEIVLHGALERLLTPAHAEPRGNLVLGQVVAGARYSLGR